MNIREQRHRLAIEAARLMARDDIADAGSARRKAARKLGITDRASQPDDDEIRRELLAYRRLFGSPLADAALRDMRATALEAMKFFHRFEPRLAGSVLDGSALASSPVVLHLHVDEAEALPRFLDDSGIPAEPRFRRMRLQDDDGADCPAWSFLAGKQAVELVVLPLSALRLAPLDGNGKPVPRIASNALKAMLEARDGIGNQDGGN